MKGIAAQRDDFRKEFLAKICADGVLVGTRPTQERAAFFRRTRAESETEPTDQIGHRSGFENDRVLTCIKLFAVEAAQAFVNRHLNLLLTT